MNAQLSVGVGERIDPDQLKSELSWVHERFSDAICATGPMLDKALARGKQVLLEGAQGILDIDQGTYPFVTSSITCRANHGAGIHPGHIDQCYGITKAYTTVGNGPPDLYEEGPGNRCRWSVTSSFHRRPRRTDGWMRLPSTKPAAQRIHGTRRHQAGRARGLDELGYPRTIWMGRRSTTSVLVRGDSQDARPSTRATRDSRSTRTRIGMAEESRKEGIDSLPSPISPTLQNRGDHRMPVVSVGVGPTASLL